MLSIFILTATLSLPRGECVEDVFVGGARIFQRVVVDPRAPITAIDATDGTTPVTLDPASGQWYSGARREGWVCVTDGTAFAWAEEANLTFAPLPAVEEKQWIGLWSCLTGGEPEFKIRRRKDGRLRAWGFASWQANPEALPHVGEFDFTGRPNGAIFDFGDPFCLSNFVDRPDACYDCVIRMIWINGRILAADNSSCGGMNVRFNGIYTRDAP
jgi:hypothetical protein